MGDGECLSAWCVCWVMTHCYEIKYIWYVVHSIFVWVNTINNVNYIIKIIGIKKTKPIKNGVVT